MFLNIFIFVLEGREFFEIGLFFVVGCWVWGVGDGVGVDFSFRSYIGNIFFFMGLKKFCEGKFFF